MEAPEPIEWDEPTFEAALRKVAAEGVIEAQGVRLSSDQLRQLLQAAPEHPSPRGLRQLRGADFSRATFTGYADFALTTFSGEAFFVGANFNDYANFSAASFGGGTWFRDATFSGVSFDNASFSDDARFHRTNFGGHARFLGATFSGDTWFDETTFTEYAAFPQASFSGRAFFGGATFSGEVGFAEAIFSEGANFGAATFSGDAGFAGAIFGGDANFNWATFEHAREFGPLLVCGRASLDRTVFAQPVRIELSSLSASCARAVFRAGADVLVRWANVSLDDADFAEPSLLAELPARSSTYEKRAFLGWEEPLAGASWLEGPPGSSDPQTPVVQGGWACRREAAPVGFEPRVVSVRRAKLAKLTLSGVDLRACRFAGAHGLDELRLERVRFAQPPSGWRRMGHWRRVRWTRRQTIAEEHHWRAQSNGKPGLGHTCWYEDAAVQAPEWLPDASSPRAPEQIAGIYRALRKGREDGKDAPGAGDFYYGEMEMRRHCGPFAERAILWLYWLVSGYGLRASRALLALAVTVGVLGAVALDLWGFHRARPYGRTLLFSIESSISLLRAPDAKLTAGGEAIQIVLRLAGPLFFGLALLSLRGRVKR